MVQCLETLSSTRIRSSRGGSSGSAMDLNVSNALLSLLYYTLLPTESPGLSMTLQGF